MARSNGRGIKGKSGSLAVEARAFSRRWASRGIRSSADIKASMSDLYADLAGDRIETKRASTMVNTSKHLLATALAELKAGKVPGKSRTLQLTS